MWVYNTQNVDPEIQRVNLAKPQRIPMATVTETLSPAGDSFEQWQVAELSAPQGGAAAGDRPMTDATTDPGRRRRRSQLPDAAVRVGGRPHLRPDVSTTRRSRRASSSRCSGPTGPASRP